MRILEICSKCLKNDELGVINTFGLKACFRCNEDELDNKIPDHIRQERWVSKASRSERY